MVFYNIEPGDSILVAFQGGFNYAKVVKVTRTTPQQIITDDSKLRYWRRNGKEVSSKRGHIIKIIEEGKNNGIKKID